jgi:threonine/homoserine/homoserine lactone efflux protein
MSESQWLSLALVCLLGAMSPGPSLVVVVRQSFSGGSRAGIACAVAHGFGIFLWAAMMVSGLGALVIASPNLFAAFRFAGVAFLFYLGIQALRATSAGSEEVTAPFDENHGSPAREGFLIALTNPKIAIFFAALFSQFIRPDAPAAEQWMIAGTAAIIDILWYAAVALLLSRTAVLAQFQRHNLLLSRIFGAILIAVALSVILSN